MYLIDGYNLLYQTNIETREELLDSLGIFLRNVNKTGLVIFDGYAPEDLSSAILEVEFVGDADLEIIKIMQKNKNPNSLILVSSDKELIYEANQNKIKVIKSEHFVFLTPQEDMTAEASEKPEPGGETLADYNNFKK